jgi:diacylglycerol kinase
MSENNPYETPPRTWRDKFADAFAGVALGIVGQSSFYVHGLCFVLVVLVGLMMRLEWWQWTALLLASSLVVCLELVNSALESLARAVTDTYDSNIDQALKIASGAVLLAAGFAVFVGMVVFVPRLLQLLG